MVSLLFRCKSDFTAQELTCDKDQGTWTQGSNPCQGAEEVGKESLNWRGVRKLGKHLNKQLFFAEVWIWQKAYPLCLHSTKGTVFTCLLPFVPVCYTNKQEFYIKVYDGTWRTLSTPFFILNNLCWTRYRWLTNVVLWIIWMKKKESIVVEM